MTDTIGPVAAADSLGPECDREATTSRISAFGPSLTRRVRSESTDWPGPVSDRRRWKRRYALLLLGADVAASFVASAAAYTVRPDATIHSRYLGEHLSYAEIALASMAAWLVMLGWSGAYRSKHVVADDRDYRVPVLSAVRLVAALIIVSYAFSLNMSHLMVLVYFPALVLSVLAGRASVNLLLRATRRRGRATARLLVVGESRAARDFADHLLRQSDPTCQLVGMCTYSSAESISIRGKSLPVVGSPDDLLSAVEDVQADAVAVANPTGFDRLDLQQVSWQLERSGVDLLVAPDVVSLAGPRIRVSSMRGLPLLHISEPRHESVTRSLTNGLFRAAGIVLAALAAPLMVVIAIAIKLDSDGPIFYKQPRVGYRGNEFEMLKFRSMVKNAEDLLPSLLSQNEHDGALFKIRHDPRVTRLGRLLRKYSLDELPQLLNVAKGDMTLVGPRPCLAREMNTFGDAERRRFMVKPGMTGLWQVSGGPHLAWADAVKVDLYYVDNWSPLLDLAILGRTCRVVLSGHGY